MSLVIELTPSEQWSMDQVGAILKGAMETHQAAEKAIEDAQNGLQSATAYRDSFVAKVLEAHMKKDPGTPPALERSKLGMRLTWPDPAPPPKPPVHVPAPPPPPKPEVDPKASPAKKAAAGRKGRAKKTKKKAGKRG